MKDAFQASAIALFLAMLFDVLDGRIARMTQTVTSFGAELDSLSDMVCFGLHPH
jgi:CDP-diacylglycerol---serine O-phosphatidyltransferase